jgi:hypothetical protein
MTDPGVMAAGRWSTKSTVQLFVSWDGCVRSNECPGATSAWGVTPGYVPPPYVTASMIV